jgi:hypothetical protein
MRRFYSWNAAVVPEAIDALSQRWDFKLAFLFPPIPLLKRVIRKLERSRGTFLLVTPYWDAQTWFASLQALHMEDVRRLPFSDDLIIDLTTGGIGGYWGVDAVSDRSFHLITAGWKQSSEDRYKRAWQSFKAFLRSSSIPFHQASLRSVLDYLTHLYDRGLSWSSIGIHRSTISMTMAPIDSVRVGDHPLIKRLMSGVFNERPSRRAAPALWDPLKVLSVFQHWPVSLPLSSLMRKGAFLMAIATAKRPSELVALLCNDNHFRWEGENLCFVLSRLTKTDRPGHLAPPFYGKSWKEDLSVCPAETVRLIFLERDRLRLQHNAIFFSWTFPHKPLDAAAFERCIQFCLVKAGIQATPGSTRSVATSAALAGSASLGDVLRLGDYRCI